MRLPTRCAARRRGIGGQLLRFLMTRTSAPTLVGTWAAAEWAVRFYEKHGFRLVAPEEKDRLLPKYWGVPPRQIETSVVLADERWFDAAPMSVLDAAAGPADAGPGG
jgi:hypothetical protein